ncbi:hypothetical protein CRG98_005612 [Punica granatum]|uniref:Retrotransposon Copia-like N-terminal domain-containing protein n=1 Tax=Punica granatum TaxID=22663 RepID=A0A2I0KZU0_PUNGR|nr:hypothetical protein CRG98_005612 [Punica granatum]
MSGDDAAQVVLPAGGGVQGNSVMLPAANTTAFVSPLTVNPSDGSVLRLIECKLNGENYLTWSRLMRMALRAKNKVGFIDGTLTEPAEGDPNKPLWIMANSLVVTWIVNSLEKDLQPSIACIENARVLWEDLRQRFAQGNETRIYQLKSDIYTARQEGRLAADYYGLLKGLWDELDNLLESVVCSCVCNCGATASRQGQREREKAHQFLMGLNSEFATVRSNILSMDPFPSLNRVYQMICQDERQRAVARSHESQGMEAAAFAAKAPVESKPAVQQGGNRPQCDFCNRIGHTRSTCYKLHGRPTNIDGQRGFSGWDNQLKPGSSKGWKGTTGKKQSNAYGRRSTGGFNQANAVQMSQNSTQPSTTLPFSEAQLQRLLSLAGPDEEGETQIGNHFVFIRCNETWIIDTGASRHMTGCSHLLFDSSTLQGDSPVFIPNGKSVQATHIGRPRVEEDDWSR